jgi:UDP-N-acetylmuramoylalanine--D-glutamate ligase
MDPRAVTAGNIKVSPLEFLDEILKDDKPRPIVLELSSSLIESLGDSGRGPDIGILTNMFPDHLNRYGSYEEYKLAKEMMFKMQKPDAFAIINKDNPDAAAVAPSVPSKLYWFTRGEDLGGVGGTFVKDGKVIFRQGGKDEEIITVADVALEGEHNLENVLAAVCAAKVHGTPNEAIISALKTFKGMPERQEVLREVNGVTYVDDTTATSPEGAMAALKRFGQKGKVVLLAGGASKNLPLGDLGKMIRTTCKYVVLFEGTATDDFVKAIGDSVPTVRVKSMAEAMQAASSVAQSGDIVLLSPGTASFGIFKNEFDRGAQFKEAVAKL